MQERVKSSRANAIPVMRQFLHHRKPKDRLVGRMDEHMNPYKAEKEFSLVVGHRSNIPLCDLNRISIVYYRISITRALLSVGNRRLRRR
jgi:hypothetical protein